MTRTSDRKAERPNIVVILADDLGFSDLGCYGSEIATPAIDSLASGGLRFSQMYNSARCCPSRAALLTGLHPHQAGIGHMVYTMSETNPAYQGFLNESCVTIAEVLRGAGYRTLMSGKWHVARMRVMAQRASWPDDRPAYPLPTERGFDEFFGTISGAGSYYRPTFLMRNEELLDQNELDWYYTDAITDNAVDMVSTALDGDEPFFLYLAYTAPHWPLHAVEEDVARYEDRYRQGWDAIRTARHEELKASGIVDSRWPISARDLDAWPWEDTRYSEWEAHRMAVYAAQIDRMDRGIGKVLDTLRSRDALDDTLIFVLSDNGGAAEFLAEEGPAWRKSEPWSYANTTPDGRPVRYGNTPSVKAGGPDTFQSYDVLLGERLELTVPPLQGLGARRRHLDPTGHLLAHWDPRSGHRAYSRSSHRHLADVHGGRRRNLSESTQREGDHAVRRREPRAGFRRPCMATPGVTALRA